MAPSSSGAERSNGPFDLSKTPIHLGSEDGGPAVPLPGFAFNGPAFEAYLAKHCKPPGRCLAHCRRG
jgi:hypothetical protein